MILNELTYESMTEIIFKVKTKNSKTLATPCICKCIECKAVKATGPETSWEVTEGGGEKVVAWVKNRHSLVWPPPKCGQPGRAVNYGVIALRKNHFCA